ncbi:MAG: DNA replication/repair protein RecF [Pseudomonadota bacterium]
MSAPSPTRVRLTRLTLTNFRNYAAASFDASAAHVVFTGPNGAGKTNILEAISLFSPGRGLRRAAYGEMGKRGTLGSWTVHARIEKPSGTVAIGTGVPPNVTSRQVRIDGDDAKVDDLSRQLRVLWLTPAMDGLFTGPTADRRRFLDRLVLAVVPDHGQRANAYERAMRQRNKMFDERVDDPRWYEAVEQQMAEHGAAIAKARLDMVLKLNAAQAARALEGVDFPQSTLAITGDEGDADEAAFLARLATGRPRDRAAGRALVGPHRADLTVTHVEKGMPAALASTGEQKALLIGIVLGHAALVARLTGEVPILLLDEVAAHLDPSRRAALYDTLDTLGAQTFMTGTDAALFEALAERADRFMVAASRIVSAIA